MNKKIIAVLLVLVAVISFVVTIYILKSSSKSSISNDNSTSVSNFTQQKDDAIVKYLLAQESFTWSSASFSKNFCVFEKLDLQQELFPLPIWINCGEFKLVDGKLQRLNGVSMPIMIDYPNELSFFAIEQFTHQAPREGSFYSADILAIFSSSIQEKIAKYESQSLTEKVEALASKNLENESSKKQITLTGKLICLSHKDKTGPQTMECAYGFRDESGADYALSDPEMKYLPTLSNEKTITITGWLTNQEDNQYDSQGLIEIISVSN